VDYHATNEADLPDWVIVILGSKPSREILSGVSEDCAAATTDLHSSFDGRMSVPNSERMLLPTLRVLSLGN
jgi:hypothetical protein